MRTNTRLSTVVGLMLGIVVVGGFIGVSPASATDPAPTPAAIPTPEREAAADPDRAGMGDDIDLDKIPSSASGIQMMSADLPGPISAGTPVVHDFDVVVASIYDSPDQVPSGPAPMQMSKSTIDTLLAGSAQWWSDQTELAFDFSQNTRYAAINTTCDTLQQDAMAAFGEPYDASVYTNSGRDLLILEARDRCGDYAGVAWTVSATGDVFAGGVFDLVINDSDGSDTMELFVNVTSHEFGHTIGLLHANVWDCSTRSIPGDDHIGLTWDGTYLTDEYGCSLTEYGDSISVMGASSQAAQTLTSLQAWYLDAPTSITVIDQPTQHQIVTLGRVDLLGSDVSRGVVIPDDTNSHIAGLGVEFRQSNDEAGTSTGVYLTEGVMSGGFETELLVPVGGKVGGVSWLSPPLEPGQIFVSADGRTSIRTLRVDETTAEVEITVGSYPGVEGAVSILHEGDHLAAMVSSQQTTTVTYQWFRNGQAIAGATGSTYTPTLPDPNAVYRVEATMTGDGRGPTTRYSRGIIVDDHRFTISGDTARFLFVDENGRPRVCVGADMKATIHTSSGALVSYLSLTMNDGGSPGICEATLIDLPLVGTFQVTAESVSTVFQEDREWLGTYWQPASLPWTRTASTATATLFIGSNGGNVVNSDMGVLLPTLEVGIDAPSLPVVVSVTDESGGPASGVPVSLNLPPGLVMTPHDMVTDSEGLAYATMTWDNAVKPPDDFLGTIDVEAEVRGFDHVNLSPASVGLISWSYGRMTAWMDKTTVIMDGVDSSALHVRVWDENGELIQNQPEILGAAFSYQNGRTSIDLPAPVWDDTNQEYIFIVTPLGVGSGWITVTESIGGSRATVYPLVTFEVGPPVQVMLEASVASASLAGMCEDGTAGVMTLDAWFVDAMGNDTGQPGIGVVFSSSDSSLVFPDGPIVLSGDARGHYSVRVMSNTPGSFNVTVTATDGSMSTDWQLFFENAPVDLEASSITVTGGQRSPDGVDSHTVTADLVSVCGVPVVFGLREDHDTTELLIDVHDADGSVSSSAWSSGFVADPTQPGVYTATVTSNHSGTYDAVVSLSSWDWIDEVRTQRISTLATVTMEFEGSVPPVVIPVPPVVTDVPVVTPPVPSIRTGGRAVTHSWISFFHMDDQ